MIIITSAEERDQIAGHWDNKEIIPVRPCVNVWRQNVLISPVTKLLGLTLKWYTDNQNVARKNRSKSQQEGTFTEASSADLSLVHHSGSKL